MKKVYTVVVLVFCIPLLSCCGSNEEKTEPPSSEAVESETPHTSRVVAGDAPGKFDLEGEALRITLLGREPRGGSQVVTFVYLDYFLSELRTNDMPRVKICCIQSEEEARMAIRLMTEETLKDALANRPRSRRDQGVDNPVLAPVSTSINRAIQHGDFRLAATVFRENYAHILEYERQDPLCEVHKGALAFDVARAYLQGWDFFAAMLASW